MHNQPIRPLKELETLRKQATTNANAKERIKAWLYDWLLSGQIDQVSYNEAINQLDRIN